MLFAALAIGHPDCCVIPGLPEPRPMPETLNAHQTVPTHPLPRGSQHIPFCHNLLHMPGVIPVRFEIRHQATALDLLRDILNLASIQYGFPEGSDIPQIPAAVGDIPWHRGFEGAVPHKYHH